MNTSTMSEQSQARFEELKAKGWESLNAKERSEYQALKLDAQSLSKESVKPEPKEEKPEAASPEPADLLTLVKGLAAGLYGVTKILGKYLTVNAGTVGMSEFERKELITNIEKLNKSLNG